MKKLVLVWFLTTLALHGKDLGKFGASFNVIEESFVEKIMRMLKGREDISKDMEKEAMDFLKNKSWSSPVAKKTVTHKVRKWQKIFVLQKDIKTPKGEIVAKKGDTIDILKKLDEFGLKEKYRILFIHGDDKAEAEYAKEFLVKERIKIMKKFEKDDGNNPAVLMFIGICLRDGKDGINVDMKKAKEYFKKAFDIAKDDEKKEAKILLDDIDNPNREKRPGSESALFIESKAVMEKGFVVLNGGNPIAWQKSIGRGEEIAPDIQFDYGLSVVFGIDFMPAVVFEKDDDIFIEEFRPEDGPKAFNEV